MHSTSYRRGLAAAVLGLSVSFGVSQPLFAQGDAAPPSSPDAWVQTLQMPEGWEAAGWEQFTRDWAALSDHLNANNLWQKGFDQDHYTAVIDRAWVFLLDEQVMAQGDIQNVTLLVSRFAHTQDRYEDDRGDRLRVMYAVRLANEDQAAVTSYQEMLATVRAINRAELPDHKEQVAALKAAWVLSNDISQLAPKQRLSLLSGLSQPALDMDHYSVRFQGRITLPETGAYVFDRLAVPPSRLDWARVTIEDEVVLDTSLNDEGVPRRVGAAQLNAGELPITIEFSRDATAGLGKKRPELVLTWRLPGGQEQQLMGSGPPVPAGVFKTDAGGPGLSGTFYDEPDFAGEVAVTRVVPSLQFDRRGACPAHAEAVSALKASLLDPEAIDDWAAPEQGEAAPGWGLFNTLGCFTISERRSLLRMLIANHPDQLGAVKAQYFVSGLSLTASIPDDTGADLVAAWAGGRPRFESRAAPMNRKKPGSYLRVNEGASLYSWMLRHLANDRWDLVERIRDTALVEAGGTCDLEVLKLLLLCYAVADERHIDELSQYVQGRIDGIDPEQAGVGDRLANWYVAKAVCAEYGFADLQPQPLADLRSMELAFAAAESADVRFWVLNEHAARLASLGKIDELGALIDAAGGGFTAPGQVAALEEAQAVAQSVLVLEEKVRAEMKLAQLRDTLTILNRRLSHAQARGDQAEIDRFGPRVQKAQAAYDEALAAYESAYPNEGS